MAQSKQLKIFFYAVDGIGHLNACVGLAQALAKRGHRIYFLLNDAFAGQLAKLGFDKILLKQKPKQFPIESTKSMKPESQKPEAQMNPVKMMAEILIKTGFLGPKSPLEKIKDQLNSPNHFMISLYEQAVEYNPQIADAIEREKPDMFMIDSFLVFPAILRANIPWITVFSPNPSALYNSEKLPPFGSGYASDSDPETWKEYIEVVKAHWKKNFTSFQYKLNKEFNYEEENSNDEDTKRSPYLNVYGFPAELDYDDVVPRPGNLAQLDTFCREVKEEFEVPEALNVQPGDKLIYVSLGSMGSIDVDLMKRITTVLAKTPYKYIVSKGQRGDEYKLPSNCWGANFLPQTGILPIVDLVITHGSNNTITETFLFGKPMIVMPMFADQYDNAQRVHEKGFGIRVEPYEFTETQLISTIDQLLNNSELANKVKAVGERMSKSNSKERVVKQLEQIVAKFQEQQQKI